MKIKRFSYYFIIGIHCLASLLCTVHAKAQEEFQHIVLQDSLKNDSIIVEALNNDTISIMETPNNKVANENVQWTPNPTTATWLALVFPGAGQIYNKKYWKLPIIYGGFLGCLYALQWNGQMYSDYQQAYLDIMDADPNTKSYMGFLPSTYDVEANEEYLIKLFKNRKDRYRRYRDLSVFCFIGVYLVSVIDAYVDAELSVFDISKDLTLKIAPNVIQNNFDNANYYGVHCSINF